MTLWDLVEGRDYYLAMSATVTVRLREPRWFILPDRERTVAGTFGEEFHLFHVGDRVLLTYNPDRTGPGVLSHDFAVERSGTTRKFKHGSVARMGSPRWGVDAVEVETGV